MIMTALISYLPVVEDWQGKGLSLCVCAEVSLEAEGVDSWDEGLDGVQRRTWDGRILGHMTSVTQRRNTCQDYKDNGFNMSCT